jgi:hypothetical protein
MLNDLIHVIYSDPSFFNCSEGRRKIGIFFFVVVNSHGKKKTIIMASASLSGNSLSFSNGGVTVANLVATADTLTFNGDSNAPVSLLNVSSIQLPDGLAASQAYTNNLINGLKWMPPVRTTSLVDVSLADLENNFSVGGVTVATGDYVLLAGQTSLVERGVYVVPAVKPTTDANRSVQLPLGATTASNAMFTLEGTNADIGYVCSTNDALVGTDPLAFVQFTGSDHVGAGNGLSQVGNVLNVNVDSATITISGNNLGVPDAGITNPKLLNDSITVNPGAGSYLTTTPAIVALGGSTVVDVNLAKVVVTDVDQVIASNKTFADSNYVAFGTGDDMKISHDGTNALIENSTGDTNIKLSSVGGASSLSVVDSGDTQVLGLDSSGNMTVTGDVAIADNSINTTGYSIAEVGGALVVDGVVGNLVHIQNTDMTVGGIATVTDTTVSTSVATGAVVVDGGVGIAGQVFTGGAVAVNDTTASTSFSTGSLIVSGGMGVASDMYCGGSIFSSSDRTLKRHIETLNPSDATTLIREVKPVSYEWIDEQRPGLMHGVIAQELQEICPQMVTGEETLAVDYQSLFCSLLASHQDALHRLDQLEAQM